MVYIANVALAVFMASFIAALAGFGVSTILIPVLAMFLPLPVVLLLVALIRLMLNLWQFFLTKRDVNWKVVINFGLVGAIASFFGGLVVAYQPQFVIRLLGGFLVFYVIFLFFNPTIRIKLKYMAAVIGGGINGFFAGVFGMRGALQSMFLSAFSLPVRAHVATLSFIALIIDCARISAYWIGGVRFSVNLLYIILLILPVSFIGITLANYVSGKVSQRIFRFIVAFFLFLIGIRFLIWGTGYIF